MKRQKLKVTLWLVSWFVIYAGFTSTQAQVAPQDSPSPSQATTIPPDSKATVIFEATKTIVTFILGFFTSVFAEPIRRWVLRPRLAVHFDNEPGEGLRCISKTPDSKVFHPDAVPDGFAYYVRVMVKNKSRSTAKDCRAYLTKIEKVGKWDQYVTTHQDPLPLAWAFVGHSPISLPPRMEFFFDVFSTKSFDSRVIPMTNPQPMIWKKILTDKAKYKITVSVTGENVDPVTTTVEVEWSDWNNFVVWSGFSRKTKINS